MSTSTNSHLCAHSAVAACGPNRPIGRQERSRRTAQLVDEVARCTDEARREELLAELIVVNRGVAESVAARYRHRGVAIDDLNQVAYLGLTRAVRNFDATRAEDLLTYAVPTIRGELLRYFRDHGWSVRPTRRVQELQRQMNRVSEEIAQTTGREPSHRELQEHLCVDYEEYAEAVSAFGCFQPTSLDRPASADSPSSLGELIGVDQPVDAADARTMLRPLVRGLSARDQRVLYLRFFEDRTQEEIGHELGVTQMQVSRVLKRILTDLRRELVA
jgi:RNA polymerase sigma-B factor